MRYAARWLPRQDAIVTDNRDLSDETLAEMVSAVGPARTAQAVKDRRYDLDVLRRQASPWSDPEVAARLLAHYGHGLSGAQIAKALNEEFGVKLSRNAVIGRLHRVGAVKPERLLFTKALEGLEKRVKARRTPPPPKAARTFQHGSGCVVDLIPKDAQPIRMTGPLPASLNLPMWHQDFGGCRYPTSAEEAPETTFCCVPTDDGETYCPSHSAVCASKQMSTGAKSDKEWMRSLRRFLAA